MLYLKNNLTTGTFTPDRLETLSVLSSQAAISLENARQYRTLEQKVQDRTVQLADANKEITALNEQLKSENVKFLAAINETIYQNVQRMNTDKSMTLSLLDYQDSQFSLSGQHEEVIFRLGLLMKLASMSLKPKCR